MKKIFIVLFIFCLFSSVTYALSIYDPISDKEKLFPNSARETSQQQPQPKMMINGNTLSWVSDINAKNGHVTYTLNVQIPLQHKNDIILAQNRRDYSCAQDKEAILWGKAQYLYSGEIIDYTPYMDKTRLRKYVTIDDNSKEVIDQIIPYCN